MYKIREYSNNCRLIYKKIEGLSSVSLGLWLDVGSRNEDIKINGVSHFLEHLVFKGSKKYSGDEIKESVEGLGGALNAFTSEENTCYYAKFLGRHLDKISDVLSSMVLHPLLKAQDIEKERGVILEEIKMYKDLPQYQAAELFDELLWPKHPLGRNIAGTVSTVSSISRAQIYDYHKKWYGPASLVIACAGNLDEKLLESFAKSIFSKINPVAKDSFKPFHSTAYKSNIKVLSKDNKQTQINLGFPAFNRSHPDRFALGVLHVILGGNMSSRLFNEVREKKGLAYEIASHAKKLKDTGVFSVHAGIENNKVLEATRLIFKELARIKKDKVSAGEIRRAKDFYSAQVEMALDDSLEHMLWMGESLTNLGFIQTKEELRRGIEGVCVADILRIARDIIRWEKLCFAAVGPQKASIEDDIKDIAAQFCKS